MATDLTVNGIRFDSCFDSGNLGWVREVPSNESPIDYPEATESRLPPSQPPTPVPPPDPNWRPDSPCETLQGSLESLAISSEKPRGEGEGLSRVTSNASLVSSTSRGSKKSSSSSSSRRAPRRRSALLPGGIDAVDAPPAPNMTFQCWTMGDSWERRPIPSRDDPLPLPPPVEEAGGSASRSWFHFRVSNVPVGTTVHFVLMNLNSLSKLYKWGLRPLAAVAPPPNPSTPPSLISHDGVGSDPLLDLGLGADSKPLRWSRVQTVTMAYSYSVSPETSPYRFTKMGFKYTFHPSASNPDSPTADSVVFALCHPHTYTQSLRLVDKLASVLREIPASPSDPTTAFLHRETLTLSPGGRVVELLTISDRSGLIPGSTEPPPSQDILAALAARKVVLFPEGPNGWSSAPAWDGAVKKRTIFLSARVHPGETPASHMMQGALEFLLDPRDPRAIAARAAFVWKIIPVLAPDGVARGHYRQDRHGTNLNRVYETPDPVTAPSIYAVKMIVNHWASTLTLAKVNGEVDHLTPAASESREERSAPLYAYVDFHAHAGRRGAFVFGNPFPGQLERQVEAVLLARLLELNCTHFDFSQSTFANNLKVSERDGGSKDGAGRVAIARDTGLTLCYTYESNYASQSGLNRIPAAVDDDGTATPPPPPSASLPPPYTPKAWRSLGKALPISFLDVDDLNPWSRLPLSRHRSLEALRNTVTSTVSNWRLFAGRGRRKAAKNLVRSGSEAEYSAASPDTTPGGTPQQSPRQASSSSSPVTSAPATTTTTTTTTITTTTTSTTSTTSEFSDGSQQVKQPVIVSSRSLRRQPPARSDSGDGSSNTFTRSSSGKGSTGGLVVVASSSSIGRRRNSRDGKMATGARSRSASSSSSNGTTRFSNQARPRWV